MILITPLGRVMFTNIRARMPPKWVPSGWPRVCEKQNHSTSHWPYPQHKDEDMEPSLTPCRRAVPRDAAAAQPDCVECPDAVGEAVSRRPPMEDPPGKQYSDNGDGGHQDNPVPAIEWPDCPANCILLQ